MMWVLPLLVREILLGWYGLEATKGVEDNPLMFVLMVWMERNHIVMENEEFLFQRMKNYFVFSFWSWTKLFIDLGFLSLINFFQLIVSQIRVGLLCNHSSLLFCL